MLGASLRDPKARPLKYAAMSEIGARVQGAQYLSNVSSAVAADAETSRASQAGVNLDEEAARLMQYQQGYQAAAKVLQTAQTVFAELLKQWNARNTGTSRTTADFHALAEEVSGVREVHNQIRVQRGDSRQTSASGTASSTASGSRTPSPTATNTDSAQSSTRSAGAKA